MVSGSPRSLVAAIDEITGYSEWDQALARDGGLPSLDRKLDVMLAGIGGSRNAPSVPRYDEEQLWPLIRDLQTGAAYVDAIVAHTHNEITLPQGFWWGGWLLLVDRTTTAATLQALLKGRRIGSVYLRPQLLVPQPERGPGRPSLRPEIAVAYDALVATGEIHDGMSWGEMGRKIRIKITGSSEVSPMLDDQTIRLAIIDRRAGKI
jgi:hypothetical protein